jgi:hypothetical protein
MKLLFWIVGTCALVIVLACLAVNIIAPPPITVKTRNAGHVLTLPRYYRASVGWFVVFAPVRVPGLPRSCYVLLYKNKEAWLLNPDDGWSDEDIQPLIGKLKQASGARGVEYVTLLLDRVSQEKERVNGTEPLRAMVFDLIQTNDVPK